MEELVIALKEQTASFALLSETINSQAMSIDRLAGSIGHLLTALVEAETGNDPDVQPNTYMDGTPCR